MSVCHGRLLLFGAHTRKKNSMSLGECDRGCLLVVGRSPGQSQSERRGEGGREWVDLRQDTPKDLALGTSLIHIGPAF